MVHQRLIPLLAALLNKQLLWATPHIALPDTIFIQRQIAFHAHDAFISKHWLKPRPRRDHPRLVHFDFGRIYWPLRASLPTPDILLCRGKRGTKPLLAQPKHRPPRRQQL
jgi:hypothetical protein